MLFFCLRSSCTNKYVKYYEEYEDFPQIFIMFMLKKELLQKFFAIFSLKITSQNKYFDYEAERFCYFILWEVPVLINMLSIMKNMRTFFRVFIMFMLKRRFFRYFLLIFSLKKDWQNKYLTMMQKIQKFYTQYKEFPQNFYHVYA